MWIGSYGGLMKFSGTRIKSFTRVGKDEEAISSLEMHSVYEDKCGFIWIGTTGGLDKLDPITAKVTHYPIKSPFKESSFVGYLYSVFQDREEFIWLCTDVAMYKLDNNTGDYQTIPVQRDKHGIPNYSVCYNSFVDTEEGLWFHTADGLTFYEYETDWFYHRYHNPEAKEIFNIKKKEPFGQSDMRQDKDGRFWFVNNHKQLTSYDVLHNRIDSFEFIRPEGTWPCCYSIAIDARDNIWVGTRHGGVFVFDIRTKTFRSLKQTGINKLIQSDYIYSLERGNDGQMFVSHDNGLDIVDLYDESIRERKLSGGEDFLNLKHQSGDIFINAAEQHVYVPFYTGGFFVYDLSTDQFMQYDKYTSTDVRAPLVFVMDDRKYLSTERNIYPFDVADDVINLGSKALLPDTISKMPGQVVWFFQENPHSIYFKKSSGKLVYWEQNKLEMMNTAGFKSNICISLDSQYLYFLNEDYNLVKRNLSTKSHDTIDLQQMLKSMDFSFSNPRHIADDGSSIWMTSQTGMLRYAYAQQQLFGYTMTEGLSHGFNFSVVTDKNNDIWVGNLGGIDKYDRATNRFVSIQKINETTSMDAFGHAICTRDGKLIFHFGNKLYVINPESIKVDDTSLRKIQLSEVLINGEQIDWRNPDNLSQLRYDENRITLTYDVLEFAHPDLFAFHYRLNGREWIDHGNRTEVNFDGLSNGEYIFEVTAADDPMSMNANTLSVPFSIKPPIWKTWWFIAANAGLGIFIAGFLVRRNVQRIRAQNKIEVQVAELKSTALRAQMNPHFVFNCLNAIQECVVTGRIDEAYTYLSKFSRLLRLVLEHSDLTVITLHQEMEILDLYISLEKLRFKESMDYQIITDEDLETEEISIPPMLIQPHVENAIWHGLRNFQNDRRLLIYIKEEANEYLTVIIEDNGVGRKKAMELKASRMMAGQRHNSKGLTICTQRIELLQNQYSRTKMEIEDLYTKQGVATGTRVTVVLPIILQNQGGMAEGRNGGKA